MAVLLSRFPLSALGPWINLAAGATRVSWQRFSLGTVLGDTVWVAVYLVGGAFFAGRVKALGTTLTSMLAAVALAGGWRSLLGRMIRGAAAWIGMLRGRARALCLSHAEVSAASSDDRLWLCHVPLFGLADAEDARRPVAPAERAGHHALTDRMAAALDLPAIKVHVFDVDPVNGLAAPDGRIFLTRGFVQKYRAGRGQRRGDGERGRA